jgi:hypothetical protein
MAKLTPRIHIGGVCARNATYFHEAEGLKYATLF